jgi:hypothetical protein
MVAVLCNLKTGPLNMAQIDSNTIQWDAPPQSVGEPVTGSVDKPLRGGVIIPAKPEKPDKPREAPSGYRYNAAGNVEFIPGGPADPDVKKDTNPSEGDKKVLQLLTRIAGGSSDINNALVINPEAQQSGFLEASSRSTVGEGMITRSIAGEDRRIVTDAQGDVLDALLTLGTGAAYNEEQKAANTIAYFPQYGDTKREIAIKNERLKRAIVAARIAAGPLAENFDKSIQPLLDVVEGDVNTDAPPATGGAGPEGPAVTVSLEDSIATFGQPTYDIDGNLVGRAYQKDGGSTFDAKGNDLGLTITVTDDSLRAPARSFYEGVLNSVTGSDQSTATTERLPDWVDMPGINNLLSSAAWKTGFGTAFGGSPQEIAQIVQSNFPGTQVFQDEKGNYILRSATDGKDYAIKPGFQLSDVPRAASIIGAGLLTGGRSAMGVAGREALMQTGIEATQTATGGTFNPADIAAAAVFGGGLQKGFEVLPGAAGRVVGGIMGNTPPGGGGGGGGGGDILDIPGGIPLPGGGVSPAPARSMAPEYIAQPPPGAPVAQSAPSAAIPQTPTGGMRGTAGAMSASEETIRTQRALELPVPIELARFQRTRDFAEQQRARELAKNNEVGGPIRERMTQQQDALRQNFESFIEGTGSEVWDNPYEQGGVIADALKTLARRERTRTSALYRRAEKSGEMREPVEYKELADFIAQQAPTTRDALAPVLKTVDEQLLSNDPNKTGMISLNQMEDIRKLINKVASPGTPSAVFGRDMRAIIDNMTKDAGGDVYRQARASRAKYARDFEDIDLVEKVISNKPGTTERYVGLEKVVDRITGQSAQLDSVKHLLGLLDKAGPRGARAKRELQGAVFEKIRDQAYRGVTSDQSGQTVINPTNLNNIIRSMNKNGKIDVIFDKKTAELLNTINEVTKDIVTAPPGSVNASGTSSAVLNAIDTVATFGITGAPVPALKILNEFRKAMANRSLRKEVKRLLD